MATPKRRSSRLRSATPQGSTLSPLPSANLSALLEREETPTSGVQSKLDFIASSPVGQCRQLLADDATRSSVLSTPATATRPKPSHEQMHPGHHHCSKTRNGDSSPTKSNLDSVDSRQATPTAIAAAVVTDSPSKMPTRTPFSSISFNFKESTDLSVEARRMMDEVREQAAKIKAELAMQRDEQERKDGEAQELFGANGRKIAMPKGRRGRFSDVHMEQFKKMDSIAKHASSFRSDATRFPPAKSLKRSNSKAGLDTPDSPMKRSEMSESPDKRKMATPMSPAKRFKAQQHQIAEFGSAITSPPTPSRKFPISSLWVSGQPQPSGLTTPTKASHLRTASVKGLKTQSQSSLIPSPTRSTSVRSLATPLATTKIAVSQTEGTNKYRNALNNGLSSVKSILRRPQLRFSDDPFKVAAGTHLSTPKSAATTSNMLEKDLPDVPEVNPDSASRRREKHVNFTASTHGADSIPAPPTPTPVIVEYPTLSDLGSLTPSKPARRATGPNDFTFRTTQTIKFGSKEQPNPTIRQVRQSIGNNSTAPTGPMVARALPSVPHGIANKKRKRDSDEQDPDHAEADKENTVRNAEQETQGSPAKKAKTLASAAKAATPVRPSSPGKKSIASGRLATTPKRKGHGILSLTRLNALARPKPRK